MQLPATPLRLAVWFLVPRPAMVATVLILCILIIDEVVISGRSTSRRHRHRRRRNETIDVASPLGASTAVMRSSVHNRMCVKVCHLNFA